MQTVKINAKQRARETDSRMQMRICVFVQINV